MCREIKNDGENEVALLLSGSDPHEIDLLGEKTQQFVCLSVLPFLSGNVDITFFNSLSESQDCIELKIFLSNEK